jgi:hypothetical protein
VAPFGSRFGGLFLRERWWRVDAHRKCGRQFVDTVLIQINI